MQQRTGGTTCSIFKTFTNENCLFSLPYIKTFVYFQNIHERTVSIFKTSRTNQQSNFEKRRSSDLENSAFNQDPIHFLATCQLCVRLGMTLEVTPRSTGLACADFKNCFIFTLFDKFDTPTIMPIYLGLVLGSLDTHMHNKQTWSLILSLTCITWIMGHGFIQWIKINLASVSCQGASACGCKTLFFS